MFCLAGTVKLDLQSDKIPLHVRHYTRLRQQNIRESLDQDFFI